MPDVSIVVNGIAVFFAVGLALAAFREVIRRGHS